MSLPSRLFDRLRFEYYMAQHADNVLRFPEKLSPQRAVIIVGSGRSGTSWLAQVLRQLPGTLLVNEPFKPPILAAEGVQVGWRQHVPEDARWPELEDFFFNLFRGLTRNRGLFTLNNYADLRAVELPLIKINRIQLLLPWLLRRLGLQRVVFLVRNPYAVIASQMRHGGWDNNGTQINLDFSGESRHYQEPFTAHHNALARIDSREGVQTANWAITNGYLLSHPENNRSWVTLCYEDLVLQPEAMLRYLFRRLGLELTPQVLAQVRNPSYSSKDYYENEQQRLTAWKERLNEQQRGNIRQVLHALGFGHYTDAGEPDRQRIYNGQLPPELHPTAPEPSANT